MGKNERNLLCKHILQNAPLAGNVSTKGMMKAMQMDPVGRLALCDSRAANHVIWCHKRGDLTLRRS